jgi:hypothetical protein
VSWVQIKKKCGIPARFPLKRVAIGVLRQYQASLEKFAPPNQKPVVGVKPPRGRITNSKERKAFLNSVATLKSMIDKVYETESDIAVLDASLLSALKESAAGLDTLQAELEAFTPQAKRDWGVLITDELYRGLFTIYVENSSDPDSKKFQVAGKVQGWLPPSGDFINAALTELAKTDQKCPRSVTVTKIIEVVNSYPRQLDR